MTLTPKLESALRSAWSQEVTWTPDRYAGLHPSTGCSGVTAFAVWMFTDSAIRTGFAGGRRHYWNVWGDLTAEQFEQGAKRVVGGIISVNELLPNDWFRARAALYLHRVMAAMEGNTGETS